MSKQGNKEYKATFVPVFLVIDTSWSMGEDQPDSAGRLIDVANQLVPMIVEKCQEFPTLDQRMRLSLIQFSGDASVLIPLDESDKFKSKIPTMQPDGTTDFGAAFELLYSEINDTVPALRGGDPDIGVYRPTAFLITDADDNGDAGRRDRAWDSLIDESFKFRPNFFTFGVGNANAGKLKTYKAGHGLAAVAKDPAKAVQNLTELLGKLVQSIVSSSVGSIPTGNISLTSDDFDPDSWDVLG